MKRIVLCAAAALFAPVCLASWSVVGKSPELSDVTVFINESSAARTETGNVEVWVLRDAKKSRGGVRSTRSLYNIDCAGRELAVFDIYSYADQMARGKLVEISKNDDVGPRGNPWKPVRKGSSDEMIFKRVCG